MRRSGLISLVLLAACGAPARPTSPPPVAAPADSDAGVTVPEDAPDGAVAQARFPATRRGDDADVIHGVTVADPYRWLEDVDKPEVRAWMSEQNERARAFLAALPARAELARRFT